MLIDKAGVVEGFVNMEMSLACALERCLARLVYFDSFQPPYYQGTLFCTWNCPLT